MIKGPFSPAEFIPTEWSTAAEKAEFGNTLLHFLDSGCPRELFTKKFYTRLSMTFGNIAHYNLEGFYDTWFTGDRHRAGFVLKLLRWPCHGDPKSARSSASSRSIWNSSSLSKKSRNGRPVMQVHVSIGETHHFELSQALLIYTSQRQSFVTRHEVTLEKSGPPSLGPAQPLTLSFVESLVRALSEASTAEVLPENVLAKGDRMIAWWTPAARRQMFYESPAQDVTQLNGRTFPPPPLVWRAEKGDLKVRALIDNKRPRPDTKMAVAPFWNLSEDGRVCTGSMRRPDSATVASIAEWERGFYESAFTHANVGRLTRHPDGFEGLWSELAGKKLFPAGMLIRLPQTLALFVRGDRR